MSENAERHHNIKPMANLSRKHFTFLAASYSVYIIIVSIGVTISLLFPRVKNASPIYKFKIAALIILLFAVFALATFMLIKNQNGNKNKKEYQAFYHLGFRKVVFMPEGYVIEENVLPMISEDDNLCDALSGVRLKNAIFISILITGIITGIFCCEDPKNPFVLMDINSHDIAITYVLHFIKLISVAIFIFFAMLLFMQNTLAPHYERFNIKDTSEDPNAKHKYVEKRHCSFLCGNLRNSKIFIPTLFAIVIPLVGAIEASFFLNAMHGIYKATINAHETTKGAPLKGNTLINNELLIKSIVTGILAILFVVISIIVHHLFIRTPYRKLQDSCAKPRVQKFIKATIEKKFNI